ncbi:MAG: MerR family transcriptional regulator [Actinomycetota bacterium]|nr:MerR family transcriptional regulator [Actinomycetota bacterium]
MRLRVDELAARSGLSVDTVRFYQSKGLLGQPEREGRIAWYSHAHLEQLERVRALKERGFTLDFIRRLLTGELDPIDAALAAAVSGPVPGEDSAEGEPMTLEQLAAHTGVSGTLLEAIARTGLLLSDAAEGGYTSADADAVGAGLKLLEAGLPLSELLDLARRHDAAMTAIAEQAVDVFVRFVRDPLRASADADNSAAERIVESFNAMLPATATLVAHHFRRRLLQIARDRMEREGVEGLQAASGPTS